MCGHLPVPHCRAWSLYGTRNKGFLFHFKKEYGSRATKVTQPGQAELWPEVPDEGDMGTGTQGLYMRCLKRLWALSVTGRMTSHVTSLT